MAGVGIHLALHEHCHASPPAAGTARTARDKTLRIFDEQIDSLSPKGDYKARRRAVLVETLRKYLEAAEAR